MGSVKYDVVRVLDPDPITRILNAFVATHVDSPEASDSARPEFGAIFYYILQAKNDCVSPEFACP